MNLFLLKLLLKYSLSGMIFCRMYIPTNVLENHFAGANPGIFYMRSPFSNFHMVDAKDVFSFTATT